METQVEKPKKPSFEEVHTYVLKTLPVYLHKHASRLPAEQKEEIEQNALMRAWESYQKLDPERGWKSFIQLHCRGSVLDYLKGGDRDAAAELGWDRVEIASRDSGKANLDVEDVVGIMNATMSAGEVRGFNPKWDLLYRMAPKDENLHIICKVLLGYSQEVISEHYVSYHCTELSRERISQLFYEYFKKLNSLINARDPWTLQCVYALGLSEQFGMDDKDMGLGWDCPEIDLNDDKSFEKARKIYNPSLFDIMEH